MVSQQNKCNIKKLNTQIHHIRHKSLKDTNNINQANQSKISVYIQYTIQGMSQTEKLSTWAVEWAFFGFQLYVWLRPSENSDLFN